MSEKDLVEAIPLVFILISLLICIICLRCSCLSYTKTEGQVYHQSNLYGDGFSNNGNTSVSVETSYNNLNHGMPRY